MKNHAFLSFAHEDLRTVDQFRGEMEDRYPELSLVDHPVTQPFGDGFSAYIRGLVAQTIQTAPMTICLISERTGSSPWVGWAIDKAHSLGKDILGVRLQSDPTKDVPPAALVSAGAKIVDRDINEIVALIFESNVAARVDITFHSFGPPRSMSPHWDATSGTRDRG
jgi:antiphage defense system Thoeris ThsB-like protein